LIRVAIIMAAFVVLAIVIFQVVPLAESPERVFDKVWQTFDEHYALFEVKGVDWQALHDEYHPQISGDSSEEELFDVLTRMLSHLDDNHVMLRATSLGKDFNAGNLGPYIADLGLDGALEWLDQRPLASSSFRSEPRLAGADRIQYGWLDDRVGYLHLGAFEDVAVSAAAVDTILLAMTDARAWIVDVRFNSGGDDRVGKAVADRFADRRRLYMVTRDRHGPEHDDFGRARYWHVDPAIHAFNGPVILLTNRLTISAAENFALAMRTLPHVTVVGDTTSGCMADMQWFDLPNGWRVSLSRNLFVDYDDRCWEGIGVPPDTVIAALPGDPGTDAALAAALQLLQGDGPPLQDESASAAAARFDLVEILEELLESDEFPAVRQRFDRLRQDANPEQCHADRDEINALGYRMLRRDRVDDAVGVFQIYVELKPHDANAYDSLGEAYMVRGDTELAIANYERSLELDPDNRNAERMLRRLR
jgi:C-terminal processing protease CtpA/Prc